MKKFESENYYIVEEDEAIIGAENRYFCPTDQGVKLLSEYYKAKSSAEIKHVSIAFFSPQVILNAIDNLREKHNGNFRQALLLRERSHTRFFVLCREDNREGILIADSFFCHAYIVKDIMKACYRHSDEDHKNKKINLYFVKKKRQGDTKSCHIDAVALGYMATRKNQNGQYCLPNLLSFLSENSISISETGERQKYFQVTALPEDLLITAHRSSFIKKLRLKPLNHTNIKNYKTFDELRDKYKANVMLQNPIYGTRKKCEISTYLQQKSFKYAKLMETQFYFKEIYNELGEHFNKKRKSFFMQSAKKELQEQEMKNQKIGLHNFAKTFLDDVHSDLTPT